MTTLLIIAFFLLIAVLLFLVILACLHQATKADRAIDRIEASIQKGRVEH